MWLSPEQEALIQRVFESYLTEHHHADVLQLIADPDVEAHHAVVVNAMTLFEANMEVGDYFIAYPHDVLAVFDKVLQRKAQLLTDEASSKHDGYKSKKPRIRCTLHARITGLPVCPELTRVTTPRSRDVGHFLSVTGTVIRTSVAKVLEFERDYMCTKCGHVFSVQADFDQYYTFVPPMGCPNPAGCKLCKFTCLTGRSEPAACRDYQEIKIQEQVQRLCVGSVPRSVVVVLEDDLVDSCKSGDDVTVYGVMCLRWKPFCDGSRCVVELVLKANNIERNNQQAAAALLINDVQKEFKDYWHSYKQDPLAGRNRILLSLCPQVFGMYVIKLAVAMVLAGGVQRVDSSGTKIRGECHMLLVGDPGTGKSQFLKYAAKVMCRSVLTAGIGSTNAGLTVAAVKDGGDWHLEAGALVLADGGLCCIDEFNSIKENDRISIHEAMEQQSISVAKAGIVCKLNTRTTILAATNPKSQYNCSEPLCVNVALASPLLSRFDLVLVLLDTRNEEWDRIISTFILEDKGLPTESSGLWSLEKMKAYFSVIRGLQPKVSEEATCILARYYQLQRCSHARNVARTTVRMLESLSRLAEAHARLMYRETVTIEDAVMAVSIMECSMQGGSLLGDVNALLTCFPADAGQQYRTQCHILLTGLNLPLLLRTEMHRLALLQSHTAEAPHCPLIDPSQQDLDGRVSEEYHNIPSNLKAAFNWGHTNTASLSPQPDLHTQPGAPRCHSVTPPAHRVLSSAPKDHRRLENPEHLPRRPEDALQSESQTQRSRGTLADHHTVLSQQHREEDTRGCDGEPAAACMSSTSSMEEKRNLTGEKSMSAEACTRLQRKLSPLIFNSPKIQPLNSDRDATSKKNMRTSTQKPLYQEEPPSSIPHAGKKKRNKLKHVSKGRGMTSETRESSSKAGSDFKLPNPQNVTERKVKLTTSGGRNEEGKGPGIQCQGKPKDLLDHEADLTVTYPAQSTRNLVPIRSVQTNNTVGASAGAKLARFSFTFTSEPRKTAATEEESPRNTEETVRMRTPTGARRTLCSPSHSPDRKKLRRTAQTSSQDSESTTQTATVKVKEMRAEHASNMDARVQQMSPARVSLPTSVRRKRSTCLEPGLLSHDDVGSDSLSGLSLLASTASSNDVFDTDWNQEVITKVL